MTRTETHGEQDPLAFAFGRLGAPGFIARNLVPRFPSWAAVETRRLAQLMIELGKSGIVVGDRYPSGRFAWALHSAWHEMDVTIDGAQVCTFRNHGLLGGGFKNLRENRPVFLNREPGTYVVEVPTDITEPALRVSVELVERQVLVVEVHPAVGRRPARIDVLAGNRQVVASSG